MLNGLIRISARPHQPFLFPYSLPTKPVLLNSTVRFAQAESGANEMDSKKESDPQSKTTDSMSSFGEAYATRSDEEGYGGIYGANQYVGKDGDDKNAAEESEESQGSEVKEKEKGRNQEKILTHES